MTDLTPTDERWLPVPQYVGFYDISDLGRVRSVRHETRAGWRGGRVLKSFLDGDGYPRVNLSRYGKVRSRAIHVLVLTAFVRPPAAGEQGRHGTGGKTDNSLSNLSWGTPQENSDDKYRDGTMARGERQGNSKLSTGDIREIRRRRDAGELGAVLAQEFGVSATQIYRIALRQFWKHVPLYWERRHTRVATLPAPNRTDEPIQSCPLPLDYPALPPPSRTAPTYRPTPHPPPPTLADQPGHATPTLTSPTLHTQSSPSVPTVHPAPGHLYPDEPYPVIPIRADYPPRPGPACSAPTTSACPSHPPPTTRRVLVQPAPHRRSQPCPSHPSRPKPTSPPAATLPCSPRPAPTYLLCPSLSGPLLQTAQSTLSRVAPAPSLPD